MTTISNINLDFKTLVILKVKFEQFIEWKLSFFIYIKKWTCLNILFFCLLIVSEEGHIPYPDNIVWPNQKCNKYLVWKKENVKSE